MVHINSYLVSNYEIRKKRKHFWWLFEKGLPKPAH
jgi:hypothetical protein